jgi:hypothetical protein
LADKPNAPIQGFQMDILKSMRRQFSDDVVVEHIVLYRRKKQLKPTSDAT